MAEPDPSTVIVAARRTPMGALNGCLAHCSAPELASIAIRSLFNHQPDWAEHINEAIIGQVLMAGQGQAPARQAVLGAGLPEHIPCTTINKMCGSGLQALILAHQQIQAGMAELVLAGGMESMSNAPYLLAKARQGYRLGHGQLLDHLFLDGLEDAYERGRLMGSFADDCARQLGISRSQQDDFALHSLQRAQTATADGAFQAEIAAVSTANGLIEHDEAPQRAQPEKIPRLKPVFSPDGTVTAANASSIADGAAVLLLGRADQLAQWGMQPLARIVAVAGYAARPADFCTAPIMAIQRLLSQAGWASNDVDWFEINEAFAVVTLAAMQHLKLPIEKVNQHGGACALGHPIGASGARIVTTLVHGLIRQQQRRGVAALCIGGGEALAMAIEVL
jgi:acetyl-CoA C-acetyltransferase